MAENAPVNAAVAAPVAIYETADHTPEQVAELNRQNAAMGVPIYVVDVSRFSGKLERQPDGTYRRVKLRKRRPHEQT